MDLHISLFWRPFSEAGNSCPASIHGKFTIYDSDDTKQVIKNILREFNLDDKQFQPQAVQSRISGAKNRLIDPASFRKDSEDFYSQKIADIYEKYQQNMKKE